MLQCDTVLKKAEIKGVLAPKGRYMKEILVYWFFVIKENKKNGARCPGIL